MASEHEYALWEKNKELEALQIKIGVLKQQLAKELEPQDDLSRKVANLQAEVKRQREYAASWFADARMYREQYAELLKGQEAVALKPTLRGERWVQLYKETLLYGLQPGRATIEKDNSGVRGALWGWVHSMQWSDGTITAELVKE